MANSKGSTGQLLHIVTDMSVFSLYSQVVVSAAVTRVFAGSIEVMVRTSSNSVDSQDTPTEVGSRHISSRPFRLLVTSRARWMLATWTFRWWAPMGRFLSERWNQRTFFALGCYWWVFALEGSLIFNWTAKAHRSCSGCSTEYCWTGKQRRTMLCNGKGHSI